MVILILSQQAVANFLGHNLILGKIRFTETMKTLFHQPQNPLEKLT